MPPKKGKRQNDDNDQQFLKKQKKLQQTLKKVQKKHKQKDSDQQDQQDIKKKQVFQYDFSKQKALAQHQQKQSLFLKQKQQKHLASKLLTPQQEQTQQKKLLKQQQQKLLKQQKREQKKQQREKQIQQEKLKEQQQKQKELQQEELIKGKVQGKVNNGMGLPFFFLAFIVVLCVMQYQREIYTRLSRFKIQAQEDFYDTFQIHSGVTDRQLKQKYKRLVLKYHPDKNPNCIQCQQKFNKIITAWQVLGNPQKRQHYDSNSGLITQIKSSSLTLTPQNYPQVHLSSSLWLIQVYDSTQKYCHYFSQFWQDLVNQYGSVIKFGRIDVWTQPQMIGYMPYRFKVFPTVYYVHKGELGICQINFQSPDTSLKRCLEAQYKLTNVKGIKNIKDVEQGEKIAIVFNDKIKIGSRMKIINKKYQQKFNFYTLSGVSNQSQIMGINKQKQPIILTQPQNSPTFYPIYQSFLSSLIVQPITICSLLTQCQNKQCLLLLNPQKPLPSQNPSQSLAIYLVEDKKFYQALEIFKNKTGMIEEFQIGLFRNGYLDLGYREDVQHMNIENGERFGELQCQPMDWSLFGIVRRFFAI